MDEKERFTKNELGVIHDTQTGLEWLAGPDIDTTWDQAKAFVDKIDASQYGKGWSMPTLEQLEELYEPGKGKNNIDPVFGFEDNWLCIWSNKIHDSSVAWYLDFGDLGYGEEYWCDHSDGTDGRCLAVRKVNEED
jgi:hypothetical protein